MKVLYVLKRYPRLSETFVVRELLGIETLGVEVGIDALLPAEAGVSHRETESVKARVRYLPRHPRLRHLDVARAHLRIARRRPIGWTRLALARRGSGWRRFVQAGIVADRASREGYSHLHAHFATAAAEVARDAAALSGTSFTVTAHAKDIFHTDNSARLAGRVAGAAAVVTVSDYNVEHLESVIPGIPVVRVANAMPVENVVISEGAADVGATDIGAAPRTGPVLCVARLVDKKGIDVLISAMAILADDGHAPTLDIIGSGPLFEPIQQQIATLGLEQTVRLLGPKDSAAVDAAYRACSAFVLPCRISADGDRDGMPTVLLEAMARSVPVISTDIIGIGEVVRHGYTGLLVPPEDAVALASTIRWLVTDPALAARLGTAGRRLVAERFDPSACAVQLVEVFRAASEGQPIVRRSVAGTRESITCA